MTRLYMRAEVTMTNQTNKNNYIYVNGCSFTYGTGINNVYPQSLSADDSCNREVVAKRWSTLVANHLNMGIVNDSAPGSCNDRIFRTTFAHILSSQNKPKLAIIMWSDPPRTEIFKPMPQNQYDDIDLVQINPQGIRKISTAEQLEALQMYYAFVHSSERALVHTMTYMVALKSLFENLNIPFVMMHYKPNFYREYASVVKKWEGRVNVDGKISSYVNRIKQLRSLLDHPHIFGFNSEMSFEYILKNNSIPLSKYCMGHPDEYGHKAMGDWIVKYIGSNNVVS